MGEVEQRFQVELNTTREVPVVQKRQVTVPKTVVQTSERVIDVPSVLVEDTLRENPTVQVVDVVRQVPKQIHEERVRQVPRVELAVQEVTSPRAITRTTQQVVAQNQ